MPALRTTGLAALIEDEEDVLRWAEWVAQTVLAFGGQPSTALFCAAHFAEGLERELLR